MRLLKDTLPLQEKARHAAQDIPAFMMRAEAVARSILHGAHGQKKSGTGETFWQYRDYRAGDRPQDIDWRQTAKSRDVVIRQKEWQTTQKVFFWCSAHSGMDWHSSRKLLTKSEATLVLSLALAIVLSQSDEQVGYLGLKETGKSARALERLARSLIEAPFSSDSAVPRTEDLFLPRDSSVVLASDFLCPLEEISASLRFLAGRAAGGLVIQVLDPAEIDLPYSGRLMFSAKDAPEKILIEDAAGVRAAYQARIEAHIEGVRHICRDVGWHYLLYRTDSTPESQLQALYALYEAARGGGAG